MSTNVPPIAYTPAGFVAPAEPAVLSGVQQDIQDAFAPVLPAGIRLNFTTAGDSQTNPTPQGELAESMTAIVSAMYEMFLLYVGLVDPALTYGRMQDAMARIYYLARNPAQSTVATCNCIGVNTTAILAGSVIQDSNGVLLTNLSSVTIPPAGHVQADWQANIPGPVTIAGPLTPVSSIGGWDKVTLVSQVAGTNVESSQDFEMRRSQSTSLNGAGFVAALRGRVLAVPGVLDAIVVENDTGSTLFFRGVPLLPYSIYVCVVGGSAQAVAQAIWSKKNPGTLYNGGTSAVVYDSQSGYQPPYPAYTVRFDYATAVPFVVQVTVANDVNVPSDAADRVQQAIVRAFAGQDVIGYNATGQSVTGPRARVGSTLYASRFVDTIRQLWTLPNVVSIKLGSTNSPGSHFLGFISVIGNVPTLTVSSVEPDSGAIVVGQTLLDPQGLVAPGTTITARQSGTGGSGTYTVSVAQTVSSDEMYGVTATLDDVVMNLNQVPAVAAGNVYLLTQ